MFVYNIWLKLNINASRRPIGEVYFRFENHHLYQNVKVNKNCFCPKKCIFDIFYERTIILFDKNILIKKNETLQ